MFGMSYMPDPKKVDSTVIGLVATHALAFGSGIAVGWLIFA